MSGRDRYSRCRSDGGRCSSDRLTTTSTIDDWVPLAEGTATAMTRLRGSSELNRSCTPPSTRSSTSTSCLRRSRSLIPGTAAHVTARGTPRGAAGDRQGGLMRCQAVAIIAATLLTAGDAASQAGRAGGAACDGECLIGVAEQYLDALVARDPKRLPLASGAVRYTENGQRLTNGDGLWNSMSARGTYKLHVADPVAGQIVTFITMREAGLPIVLANRLKVENRRISEIETQVARSENAAKGFEALGEPRAAFLRATPPADRVPRAELVRVANMYFSGMQLNDGKGKYPFADDCDRIENGNQSTNAPGKPGATRPDPKTATGYSAMWSCREQVESGLLHFVSRIRDRRYVDR